MVAHNYLLDNNTLVWAYNVTHRAVLSEGSVCKGALLEAGCWAAVEHLERERERYSVLTVVAIRLVDAAMFACGNTHQVYTSKEERAAALCDNRFLRREDSFDTSLCD